jgi:tetratricopeptide (TPR) repeat protein
MKPVAGVLLILSIALSLTANSQKSSEINNIKAVLINGIETEAKVSHFLQRYEQLMTVHDYTQARQYLDSVLILSEKLHFEQGVALYYYGMGLLHYKEKNYLEALNHYRIALQSGKKPVTVCMLPGCVLTLEQPLIHWGTLNRL